MQNKTLRERGQAIIEFALLIPFIMVFFFAIVDAGFFAYSYISVGNAVREGARCGVVGGTDSAISTRVTNGTGGLANTVTVATTRGTDIGDLLEVEAKYTYNWISPVGLIPGVNFSDKTYTKKASMRMETDWPAGALEKDTCE